MTLSSFACAAGEHRSRREEHPAMGELKSPGSLARIRESPRS
jgi:hypothetical protein